MVNILNVGSKIFNREKNPQDLRLRSIIQEETVRQGGHPYLSFIFYSIKISPFTKEKLMELTGSILFF